MVVGGTVVESTSNTTVKSRGLPAASQAVWFTTVPGLTTPVPVLVAAAAVTKVPLPLRIAWKMSLPASLTAIWREAEICTRRAPWSPA